MAVEVKKFFGYDDTLDVFGIHGFGGAVGAILTGVLATSFVNPVYKDVNGSPLAVGLVDGNAGQVLNQLIAVAITVAMASVGTFVILKIVDLLIGLRVTAADEIAGLDISQHGETAYAFVATTSQVAYFEGDIVALDRETADEFIPTEIMLESEQSVS
jgi:Amt family ammonium transporter